MKRKSDHYLLGVHHAQFGLKRYKWQDKFNQEEYDKGYDEAENGVELTKVELQWLRDQQSMRGTRQRW